MEYCADGNGEVFLKNRINVKELKKRSYIIRKSNIKRILIKYSIFFENKYFFLHIIFLFNFRIIKF